ncbi:MAG: response regulator [Anaerolineae bacterium]|nr:response regulator [Anaerolineae bacterium]
MGIELIGRIALSWLGVPLTVGDRVLGVMAVQSHATPRAYDDHDRDLLTAIAGPVAIAIQNAHLFEETRRRATQLAAAAEVARDTTAILDVNQLLDETVHLISGQFDFYHAGVFLVDDAGEYAVLRAASSGGGQRMLKRGHKLAVGEVGIVGHVAARGEPRVALDVGEDAFHFANPELPRTRSEMALPLTSRGRVIGVLDVQSTEATAFTQEDVTTLQTMADQLATAIENARLFGEIRSTAERLRELDRLKTQFLANMSHELRTPLNSIIGFSRVILKGIDGPLTDVQRTDLRAIYDSGQHLLSLINNILDLSKIEAGRMEVIFEDVDLREIIEGVMSTAVALVKGKPIEMQQLIAPDLPMVHGDPRRIRQVLVNLVGNATKFTEEGFIRVEAEANPTEVTITVADSGTGIEPDKLETVFEPFTQVDASTTRRAGGTGLGLSITKHFVEMHGGRIWVESTPGQGSTFYVTLPVEPRPMALEEGEESGLARADPGPDSDQKLVLCIDDNEGVVTLFHRYLSRQGYRVIGLTDGTAAVEKARQLKPFAITLDVMMPNRNGWQVIRELKADPDTRHIPVIMCTIFSDKEQGLSLGASDYLIKPILEENLVAALERLHRVGDHRRVLLVGERPEDRNLLRRMIESNGGYEVVEASGDPEAITLVRQVRPHIIILDLVSQDDGVDFLEAVKADESTRSIPIIAVTTGDLPQEERNKLNRRVEALLQKGLFEQQELLADVTAALERIKGG